MNAVEAAKAMVAEIEDVIGRHKDQVAAVEAEAAQEAAKVPTWEDVRALIARVPVA